MKIFLSKLFAFVFLVVAIAAVVQVAISLWTKNKTANGHDTFFVTQNKRNDIVFLGSSRCSDNMVPHVFKDLLGVSSVNMGMSGHGDIAAAYMALSYYLKYNPAPKFVVMNCDPIMDVSSFDLPGNPYLIGKDYYSRYAFCLQENNDMVNTYFHYNKAEQYVPLYALLKYKIIFECMTQKGGRSWMRNGYLKHDGIASSDTNVINARKEKILITYANFIKNYDSIKYGMGYMKTFCKEHGIKLVCFQPPVYRMLYDTSVFGYPMKMCGELGIPIIDVSHGAIADDIIYFNDPLHLNARGAERFCSELCANRDFLAAIEH